MSRQEQPAASLSISAEPWSRVVPKKCEGFPTCRRPEELHNEPAVGRVVAFRFFPEIPFHVSDRVVRTIGAIID